MAITGNVRTQAPQGEARSSLYGISAYKILGVNLSNRELKDLDFYVKEGDEDNDRDFVSERDGVSVAKIEFACESLHDGRKKKFIFWLENSNARNKEDAERPLYKFINDQGKCSWSVKPNVYQGINSEYDHYFTGTDGDLNPRPAKRGEEEMMLFMRSCMAINFRDGGTIKYNIKKFFANSFKELQADLETEFLTPVIVASTIKIKQEDDGIKAYESFYPYAFAPGRYWEELKKKKEFTDADVVRIHQTIAGNKGKKGKARVWVSPLEELVAKMTDNNYPCKEVFHLGLPIEYYSEGKIETSESAIIDESSIDSGDDSMY